MPDKHRKRSRCTTHADRRSNRPRCTTHADTRSKRRQRKAQVGERGERHHCRRTPADKRRERRRCRRMPADKRGERRRCRRTPADKHGDRPRLCATPANAAETSRRTRRPDAASGGPSAPPCSLRPPASPLCAPTSSLEWRPALACALRRPNPLPSPYVGTARHRRGVWPACPSPTHPPARRNLTPWPPRTELAVGRCSEITSASNFRWSTTQELLPLVISEASTTQELLALLIF
jgi:hypothetical protein